MGAVGQSEKRKEAWFKVTGQAKYVDDLPVTGYLTARVLSSSHAYAKIIKIDTQNALNIEGVKAVITGQDFDILCGPLLVDRPPIAREVVRYAGEPIAIVVALDEATAALAVQQINVTYEPLRAVFTPREAITKGAPVIHQQLRGYEHHVADVYPQEGSNIASYYPVRKGNMQRGWQQSEVIVTQDFDLPPSDHLAMEIHTARAEISGDGVVSITTTSQSPYEVTKQLAKYFQIPSGKVQVYVPFVGGGYGGKAPVTLEILAYMASYKVAGRPVRLILTRAQDMTAMPCRMGLAATIKLGATRSGKLCAAELYYWLDNGAYADIGPYMAKAIAADGTGPYFIENLLCDAYSVYTNHTYATSYRGYAHESFTFCVERAMDQLAQQCNINPVTIRQMNAIQPGQLTPTQVKCTPSNIGNLNACIVQLEKLAQWKEGAVVQVDDHTVRAQGMSCFWKAANPPTNAVSGAVITFNSDGSLNLNTGVVEMGSGSQSHLAQMLADRLGIASDQVHVAMDVDTRLSPEHYKTVASLTTYMAGKAVMRAADDILAQLRNMGAQALESAPEDIEVMNGKVYARQDPEKFIEFKDIVKGYKNPEGTSIGDPLIGRGGYMLKGLSALNLQTGQGKSGPAWTVGAQMVEVELDTRTYFYRIIRASTVMDVGKAINPESMQSMIRGGMAMGLSMASREGYFYDLDRQGQLKTPSLRSYKLLHIGEEPEYRVGYVETPQDDAPYGVRSMSEHGIIGIPAALANALSAASGACINTLPVTPEYLWKLCVRTEPKLPRPESEEKAHDC